MAWELNTISSVVLSLLHHTDAVAVLFLLVEGSAMLAISSHPTHLLPRSVYVFMCLHECVCVCFRKWCSTSLCKFIREGAETKISSLKQVRQPFGRHVPCLPCVRCICSGACPCSYYHFLCRRIEQCVRQPTGRKQTTLAFLSWSQWEAGSILMMLTRVFWHFTLQ